MSLEPKPHPKRCPQRWHRKLKQKTLPKPKPHQKQLPLPPHRLAWTPGAGRWKSLQRKRLEEVRKQKLKPLPQKPHRAALS
jgi:hypothetical protein